MWPALLFFVSYTSILLIPELSCFQGLFIYLLCAECSLIQKQGIALAALSTIEWYKQASETEWAWNLSVKIKKNIYI